MAVALEESYTSSVAFASASHSTVRETCRSTLAAPSHIEGYSSGEENGLLNRQAGSSGAGVRISFPRPIRIQKTASNMELVKTQDWKYCVIANIKQEHIDSDGIKRFGCKYFPGRRKVYLSNRYWKAAREITVMGLNRWKSKYILESVPLDLLENIRCKRTFKPRVVELMNDWEFKDLWWTNAYEDGLDAKAFAEMLKSEQTGGTGYEDYLKMQLRNGFEKEIEKNSKMLNEYGLYRDDYIPTEVLYDRSYPYEIVRSVLEENPKYLQQWPLMKEYLE